MLSYLMNLFRKRSVKNAPLLNKRSRDFRMRNAQFVSFLEESGFRHRALDRHEKTKRFKKALALAVMWSVIFGLAWVVMESAEALQLF